VAVVAALFFGTREAKKLRELADQTTLSGIEVNSAAAELSASSDELAATTTQQSAAVTQATSTTEELARASAAIADTVDDVASQTAETKDNLEQAEADITVSSERTLALATKVNDIDALLVLINDIADQTNLLALNAAIEAARAGENGLGFAVVADEVRRLAERSKTSASEINMIIAAVQGETNATVMAMEKGAKQMQRGLLLLEAVTDANAQVRMTTQQQRSATSQVVETMEQLTDSSRQVSATADQIASAAGNLADLAGNLETSANTAKDRY
jgi:methyl-accepting chemotaxis protein